MVVIRPQEIRGPIYPAPGQHFQPLVPGQFAYGPNCVPIYPVGHGPLQPLPPVTHGAFDPSVPQQTVGAPMIYPSKRTQPQENRCEPLQQQRAGPRRKKDKSNKENE